MRGSDVGPEEADALDALAMREVVERRIARGGQGGAAVLAFWQDVASRLHERGRVDAASCLLVRKGDVVGLLATLTAALVAALQAEEGWEVSRAAAWAADALATVRDWEKRAGARSVEEVAAELGGRAGGYRRLSACRSEPIRPLTRWQRVSECRLVYRLSWASTSLLGAVAQYAGDRSMVCKLNRAVLMQLAAIGSKEVFRAAVLVLEVLGLVVRERQADGRTWWYLGEVFGDGLAAQGMEPAAGARRVAELARTAAGGGGKAGKAPAPGGAAFGDAGANKPEPVVRGAGRRPDAADRRAGTGGNARTRLDATAFEGDRDVRTRSSRGAFGDGAEADAGPATSGPAAGGDQGPGSGTAAIAHPGRQSPGSGTAVIAPPSRQSPGSGTAGTAAEAERIAEAVRGRFRAMREAAAGAEIVPVGPDKGRQMLVAEFVAEVGERAAVLLPVLPYVAEVLSGKLGREGEQRWPRVRMVRYAGPVLLAAVRRAEDAAVDRALKEAEREADGLRRAVERRREDARRTELVRRRRAAPLCAVCGTKVWGLGLVGAVDGAELDPPREGRVCGVCVQTARRRRTEDRGRGWST